MRVCKIGAVFPFYVGYGEEAALGSRALVDVTCRTVQGRRLFRPSPELNEIVLGVLGRAQRLYPIRICGLAVLSSHMHLLVDADNAQQLSDFMEYACSNMAREVGRLTDWDGPVFAGRYQAAASRRTLIAWKTSAAWSTSRIASSVRRA